MKVHVDMKKCICSGMCITIAPKLFDLDAKGKLVVIKAGELDTEEAEQGHNAAVCCPVEAIEMIGSGPSSRS